MSTFRNKMNSLLNKANELTGKQEYSIKEIVDHFGEDSIFALIFLITFPTSIPMPPTGLGIETVFGGTATLILSLHIIFDKKKISLPDFIMKKKINLAKIRNSRHYERADHAMMKIESLFKKRYTFIFHNIFLKFIAVVMIFPAILMIIPVVFTNLLPSIAITLISFAFLLKDGLMMIVLLGLTILMSLTYAFFFKLIIKWGKAFIMRRRKAKKGGAKGVAKGGVRVDRELG